MPSQPNCVGEAGSAAARKTVANRRPSVKSAAARVAVVLIVGLALAVAATPSGLQAQIIRPAPAGDGTTEHFFTVRIVEARADSLTRQQLATAFRTELATANVEVSKSDLDAAVDDAMRQLANRSSKAPLSVCLPRICWEVFVGP
jgi:hypothetical protein